MAMYLVVLSRSGPQWQAGKPLEEQTLWGAHADFMDELVDAGFIVLGGPLSDGHRVVHAIEAGSPEDNPATPGRGPWSEAPLPVEAIEPWTIRLDGRR